ncbi:gamma-tubulin complex DGRIP91/SPC98 component [Cytidiella melzeri]|nr:gamma-tubulin complex DGRIP91/SPC98 component [Cytidiella melzeri]
MSASLESLVTALVPQARSDHVLKRDLTARCSEILSSHIAQSPETDIGYLAASIKQNLLNASPNGVPSLKFTNLLSRLLEQPVLSRKHASLLLLRTLSTEPLSTARNHAALPSLSAPAASRQQHPPSQNAAPSDPYSAPNGPKRKSKADVLRDYRLKSDKSHIPESLLLRDTLYLLQGISGKYVQFASFKDPDPNQLVFKDDARHVISSSTKTLILRLAEVGYLYMRVDAFVREREGKAGIGMIEQSLCHHLQSQLTEYYRLIAVLESQMSTTAPDEGNIDTGMDPREQETGLTLKRLDVWIQEWRLRMRMMSVCVEGARETHGGALVNLIHGYADNGDPFVRKFTDQLLEEVSKPFFATLHKWLFSGDLNDPFSEFFVAVDPQLSHMQYVQQSSGGHLAGDGGFGGLGEAEDITGDRESGLKLWESKYRFQKEMLPAFVGEAFGRKIFSTGKSLNFIRYSCQDSDWVATREKLSNTGGTLKYSDIAGLERSIDNAYQIASRRLFDIFFEKYGLLDHLLALKQYLLLGHGDFADQLMESLAPSLARSANTLYRHNLTATLETAIRQSSAQNDPPDVVRRLDARMLEYSHGEIGWDVFTLEYKVDAPIDTVMDSEAMVKYLKLFNHLWKIKRIESTLSKGWMRIAGGARTFLRLQDLDPEWHKVRITMGEMVHFIRQMEAYCQLEVVECSWKVLLEFLQKKEGDLDALIEAHRAYLDRMVKKVLLLSPRAGREENMLSQVRELFSIILQFREATDDFYNHSLSESAYRDSEKDQERGIYTGLGREPQHGLHTLNGILSRVREYGSTFSEKMQTLVQGLQGHPDLDCRFLAVRLSFSDFYKSKREAQQKS